MPILLLVLSLFIVSCAQTPTVVENSSLPLNEVEYRRLIDEHTVKTNRYSGFYQTFQADMTIETDEVQTAALRQRAYVLQWESKQFQSEREKILQADAGFAKFFLRFFSPEKDYDDLTKGKSIWKIYLDYSGQRFEGKVVKLKDKYLELRTLYPHMDRFSTPYEITFNVPMTTIQSGSSKVTLTSILGTAEFVFPAHK